MSGICARLGQAPAETAVMSAMTQRLTHRGSGAAQEWVNGPAGLGFGGSARAGRTVPEQPFSNDARTCWIVFDGELYNRSELQLQLPGDGNRPASGDAEVILRLYEQHGRSVVQLLRGAFAFVIWDESTQWLFAARDQLGRKPLHYARRNGQLLIASEIKALLAADPGLREMDTAAFDEYLTLRLVSSPRTLFRHIRKLPAAHTLTFELAHGLTTKRYWNLSYEPKLADRDEDLIDEWESRLVEALRAHVHSESAAVGAILNGGVDAALLVALLRKHRLVDDLPTFCLGLPYGECDDGPAARLIAQRYGTPHHERYARPAVLGALPRLVSQLDEPSHPSALWTDLIAQFVGEHASSVLTAVGGPELFGAQQRYLDQFAGTRFARWPRWVRRPIGIGLAWVPDGRGGRICQRLRSLHRLAGATGGERYLRTFDAEFFSPEFRHRLYTAELRGQSSTFAPGELLQRAFEHAPTIEPLDRMLYADLQSPLPDDQLMVQDRLMMARGVEARSPYLDHQLVEFSARLPARLKVRGRSLRYAQLELAKRHLPAGWMVRSVHDLATSLPALLKDDLDRLYGRCLSDMALARDGFLASPAVAQVLQEHRSGQIDHTHRLWLLANAETWYRLYIRAESQSAVEDQLLEPAPAAPAAA